ncbi:unnamed protein product [Allacma fusca]|uniref:Uncharacterized protein n=1 Tax=Allacma fusca TaxID=39272 RepID=A0A8J2L0L5_9HEXA|nr:unnamed protein product [Allacma fusca]
MDEREDFNAEEHVDDEDIPYRLCEESGDYLNYLLRNSSERKDRRMPITKNIKRKEWGPSVESPQPDLERKDRRLSVWKKNIRNDRGRPVGAPQSYPQRVDGRKTGRKNNVTDERRPRGELNILLTPRIGGCQ